MDKEEFTDFVVIVAFSFQGNRKCCSLQYYVERQTGKRFRSRVSVERYLKESGNSTGQQLMLVQYHRSPSKDFSLPDGWIVEKKPRSNSSRIDRVLTPLCLWFICDLCLCFQNHVRDRYFCLQSYIEPGTGNKFRSIAAVERYLQAVGNGTVDSVSMVHSRRLSVSF